MKILNKKLISVIAVLSLISVMLMSTKVKADTAENTIENSITNALNQNTTAAVTATKINTINLTVTAPAVGSKIVDENTKPNVTLEDGAKYKITWSMYIDGYPSTCPTYDAGAVFGTTVQADTWYYLEVYLAPISEDYEFDVTDTTNNVTTKVNGGNEFEINTKGGCSKSSYAIFTKVKTAASSEEGNKGESSTTTTTYETLEGNGIAVKQGEPARFRFNISFVKSLACGKVYVDGNLVDEKNYTLAEGSTIITFTKEYTDTLSVGKHTVKLAVDDGEASAEFEIKKKTNNPKTGDEVGIYIALLSIATIGLVFTAIKFRKK